MKLSHNILIVGSDSLIGSTLFSSLKNSNFFTVYGTSRKKHEKKNIFYLDLLEENSWNILKIKFDIIILCTGISKINICEKYPNDTKNINVFQLVKFLHFINAINSHIIYLSTSYVFNGVKSGYTVNDDPDPNTEYGKQKFELENILANSFKKYTILRLTKVLYPDFELFKNWFNTLKNNNQIFPYSNLNFAPVFLNKVVNVINTIVDSNLYGIYHYSGVEDISYYDAAIILGKIWNFDISNIVTTNLVNNAFPNYSSLTNSKEFNCFTEEYSLSFYQNFKYSN